MTASVAEIHRIEAKEADEKKAENTNELKKSAPSSAKKLTKKDDQVDKLKRQRYLHSCLLCLVLIWTQTNLRKII